jgi:hypothetical protein
MFIFIFLFFFINFGIIHEILKFFSFIINQLLLIKLNNTKLESKLIIKKHFNLVFFYKYFYFTQFGNRNIGGFSAG